MGPTAPPRQRVTLVTTELRAGGAERCLTELACRLDPQRFETRVVSLAPFPRERDELYRRLVTERVPLESLEARSWRDGRGAVQRMRHLWIQTQPDVVVSFLHHANLMVAVSRRRTDHWRHVANFRVADPRRGRLAWERWWLRPPVRCVCVSEAVKRYYVEAGRFASERLDVIPNGVDVEAIANQLAVADKENPANAATVGFLGRFDPQKGLDRWLPVWKTITQAVPEARLKLIGAGPQEAELKRLAADLGIAGTIEWLPWTDQPWRMLSDCRVMVFPSRWEGLSNALLEALAAGKPVVATPIEGVLEVLREGPACQIPAWDPRIWAETVVRLLNDESLAASCRVFNRQRVEQAYSLSGMVSRFAEVIADER